MQIPTKYISIDLYSEQKEAILKYAPFFISNPVTQKDLSNNRVKWVRFTPSSITNVIGGLTYTFNRTKSDYLFHLLDELICDLESYEQ